MTRVVRFSVCFLGCDMKKRWLGIPKVFRISVICALVLEILASFVCGIIKDVGFGVQTAFIGGFSVALLCVYVVWVGSVVVRTKTMVESATTKEEKDSAASGQAMKIQLGSLLKLLVLSLFLVICIVVFKMDVIAAIVGVSIIYVPQYVVPLFVKSEPEDALKADI